MNGTSVGSTGRRLQELTLELSDVTMEIVAILNAALHTSFQPGDISVTPHTVNEPDDAFKIVVNVARPELVEDGLTYENITNVIQDYGAYNSAYAVHGPSAFLRAVARGELTIGARTLQLPIVPTDQLATWTTYSLAVPKVSILAPPGSPPRTPPPGSQPSLVSTPLPEVADIVGRQETSDNDGGLQGGAVAGIAIAVLVSVLLICFCILAARSKQKHQTMAQATQSLMSSALGLKGKSGSDVGAIIHSSAVDMDKTSSLPLSGTSGPMPVNEAKSFAGVKSEKV